MKYFKILFPGLIFACKVFSCCGQSYSLTPMVLSASGNYTVAGGTELAYTVGEPVVTTLTYPAVGPAQFFLTQGFHQPIKSNIFNVALNFTAESCEGSNDGGAMVQIKGGSIPYNITWSSDPLNNGTSIDSLVPGSYTVTVTDAHGQSQNIPFTILASESNCKIKIYNGITPNGDGHNDTWIIDNIEEFPDNRVSIYNRWGSEVWSATGYNNNTIVWRGNDSKGQPLPDATYYYLVTAAGKTYKGWVELTR